jgi:hypothetical protein
MWLLMLEAGFALFLLVFIVWWTLPSNKKKEPVKSTKMADRENDAQP